MSELYRIKPLIWEIHDDQTWWGRAPFFSDYLVRLAYGGKWMVIGDSEIGRFDTLAAAKLAAESHWRERIGAAIERADRQHVYECWRELSHTRDEESSDG